MYIAANQNLISSYTVRYTTGARASVDDNDALGGEDTSDGAGSGASSTIIGNYNAAQGMLSLNYRRVVNPDRVALGAELQCSPASLESQVLVGAEFNLTRSRVSVCVDGAGRVQSALEAKLGMAPGSPSLSFAAEVDHGKDTMRFGYGLNIGG
jgi:mitochondrial import receptor subunit TOM40